MECSEQVKSITNIDQREKMYAAEPPNFESFKTSVVQEEKYPLRSFG